MTIKLDFHQTFKRLAQSPGWDALYDPKTRTEAIRTIASSILPKEQVEKGIASEKLYGLIRSWIEKNCVRITPDDREAIKELWAKCKRIGNPQNDPYWSALAADDYFIRRDRVLEGAEHCGLVADAYMASLLRAQGLNLPFELVEKSFVRRVLSKEGQPEEVRRVKALQIIQQLGRQYPRLIDTFCEDFPHFGFKEKTSLIAELCSARPDLFFKYFKKFNVTDAESLFELGNRLLAYGPQALASFVTMAPVEHKWNLSMPLAVLFPIETSQMIPHLGFSEADRDDFQRLMLAMQTCALIFNPENREQKHFINQLILWINYDVNNRFPVPLHLRDFWCEEALNILYGELDPVQGARIIDWIVAHDLIQEESPPDLTEMPFGNAFKLIGALHAKYPDWVAQHYSIGFKS